ncbi:adenosine deaminase [Lysinibacter sp. HNR]|uniref:adenosine deaminase n=1 Tax=Lysinibacter sp. HNR TaxID=3031408 RepID=UPI002435D725|nr:adenosine deaminase [Lysinibacter sp. HNR]WGD37029.1 adenosine deaminase [Lysinibacter sp. HNR]
MPTTHTLHDGTVIENLPKVSLHDHLDGGLRAQTIVEIASEIGYALPANDAHSLDEWFRASADSDSLVDYLKTFEVTGAVMQTAENLTRVAREFVVDLAADGVIYAEVRWAPEQHLRGGLTLDGAVEAVQAGFEAGIVEASEGGREIGVGQLITAMRQNQRSLEIAELAVRHRNSGVVGFDIAGPEDGFLPEEHAEAFRYLAENFFPTTVHAGEAAGLDSIRGALHDGYALRLGHGVRLAEDIEITSQDEANTYVVVGQMAQWVKDRGIALELAPTSNLQTGAIKEWGDDIEDHPFDLLYQLGFNVTVNPDNRLMSGTTISREIAILADAFSYDLEDVEQFQLNAASATFLPLEDRVELARAIEEGFRAVWG